uniref:Mitochondrial ATPase complex subunit ATP10 n=2 Tax=Heterosigma akashiwo TaxID=2829 RepID=A0A7S3Y713_HETAK
MLESWTTPYLEQRSGKSPTPHLEPNLVHLSIVEGFVLSMLRGLLTKSLAAALPAPLRPRALAAFADAESFRESLSISNRLSGYLYLVDRDGFVRWRASGKASEEELRLLLKAVDDLAAEENSSLQQQHSSKRRRGQNS